MMRRRILAMSTVAAVAVCVPTAAHAAVAKADAHAPKIKVSVADAKGDVVAKTGGLDDVSNAAFGGDGFRPGHGTVVAPTAADEAIDLTKVTYKVVRTGTTPSLKITYTVAGPFTHADKLSTGQDGAMREHMSMDGVETVFGKTYSLQTENDTKKDSTEALLTKKSGRVVKCAGASASMPLGGHVAVQTVPLSCLAAAGIKTAPLASDTAHIAMDMGGSSSSSGNSITTTMTMTVRQAVDQAAKTRGLPFTPYAK